MSLPDLVTAVRMIHWLLARLTRGSGAIVPNNAIWPGGNDVVFPTATTFPF